MLMYVVNVDMYVCMYEMLMCVLGMILRDVNRCSGLWLNEFGHSCEQMDITTQQLTLCKTAFAADDVKISTMKFQNKFERVVLWVP